MHGVGRASAAITFVNALPTGVGCALGIRLNAVAEVELSQRDGSSANALHVPDQIRTPLVEAALRGALRAYRVTEGVDVELSLRSEIPPSRGLKSSSAVASAIALAVARAAGESPAPLETALLSAEASKAANVSATGALDDALAGLTRGIVVTDNRHGKVLKTSPVDPEWEVALLIPPGTHRPSPEWKRRFEDHAEAGRAAVEAALQGDWWRAMRLNTELVEQTMGYPYAPVRQGLDRRGALGSGVSGLGPALAAVAPRERVPALLDELGASPGDHRSVALNPAGAEAVGGRA